MDTIQTPLPTLRNIRVPAPPPATGHIRVLTRPGSRGRFLLVPAFGASASYYAWAMTALADGVAAAAVSLSGHGSAADPPPPLPDLSLWLDELAAVLDGLGWADAILVGNSAGGGLSLYYRERTPERVRGLVLVDASPGGCARSTAPVTQAAIRHLYEATRPPFRIRLVQRLLRRQLAWMPPSRAESLAEDTLATHPDALESVARIAYEADLDRVIDALPSDLPVLVVRGAHDPFADPAQEPLARIAGARFVELQDAGHFPMVDRPEAFAALLTEFLERTDPRVPNVVAPGRLSRVDRARWSP